MATKEWYQRNREAVLARMREQGKKPEKKQQRREYGQRYRADPANRAKMRGYQRDWYKRVRGECLAVYGGKCACCGELRVEFLTIDHINGQGHQHRLRVGIGNHFYEWLKRNNFPSGYRVLCYNCNCSLGHYGYCPHEKK